jgi:broad specificity phosphatase PhoE
MSRLLLFRHGKASDNWATYDQLSEHGVLQSSQIGARLLADNVPLVAAYHGTMRRQRETAASVRAVFEAAGRPFPSLVELPSLNELAPGIVEAALLEEKDAAVRERVTACITGTAQSTREIRPFMMSAYFRYSRGELQGDFETWADFQRRVASTLETMIDPGRGTDAAFTSGGFIASAAGITLGTSLERTIRFMADIENASLTELRYSRSHSRFDLVRLNDIGHVGAAQRTLF